MRSSVLTLVTGLPLVTGLLLSGCASEKWVAGQTTVSPDGHSQEIDIAVHHGYSPNQIQARPDLPIKLHFKRDEETSSCAKDIQFPEQGITTTLPNHETHTIALEKQPEGKTILFQCTMDMMHGKITVGKPNS